MTGLKIVFATISEKYLLLATTIGVFLASKYFFNSSIISLGICLVYFFCLYCLAVGPRHLAMRRNLALLESDTELIDTGITPYSPEMEFFEEDSQKWFSGRGMIMELTGNYQTKLSKQGVLLHCCEIPYSSVYVIPWGNIKHINTTSETMAIIESVYEISFDTDRAIHIPLKEENFIRLKAHSTDQLAGRST
ncbi:hypothetical protein [Thalassotalea litorea]|uniref:hypothetical protein n=1 Tax=Thalassotalea litorea TaxID=2020715 RepID=UPI003735B81D